MINKIQNWAETSTQDWSSHKLFSIGLILIGSAFALLGLAIEFTISYLN